MEVKVSRLVEAIMNELELHEIDDAIMDKRIKNPETGNMIKVKSALSYLPGSAVHKAALQTIRAAQNSGERKRENVGKQASFDNQLKFARQLDSGKQDNRFAGTLRWQYQEALNGSGLDDDDEDADYLRNNGPAFNGISAYNQWYRSGQKGAPPKEAKEAYKRIMRKALKTRIKKPITAYRTFNKKQLESVLKNKQFSFNGISDFSTTMIPASSHPNDYLARIRFPRGTSMAYRKGMMGNNLLMIPGIKFKVGKVDHKNKTLEISLV